MSNHNVKGNELQTEKNRKEDATGIPDKSGGNKNDATKNAKSQKRSQVAKPQAQSRDADEALELIDNLSGTITRDGSEPGQPRTVVEFDRTSVTDADLAFFYERKATMKEKREILYSAMPPQFQKLADFCSEKLAHDPDDPVEVVARRWDVGYAIAVAQAEYGQAEYGLEFMYDLALYLNRSQVYLNDMRHIAEEFTRQTLLRWTRRPMSNGNHLTEAHWRVQSLHSLKKWEDLQVPFLGRTVTW